MQGALRHDRIAIPNIWLAVAVSILLHALLLTGLVPRHFLQPSEEGEAAGRKRSLAVRLEPKPSPPPPPPAPAVPERPPEPILQAPAPRAAAPRAVPRAPVPPRVMTTDRPATAAIPAPPPEPVPPAPAAPSSPGGATDLSAYIAARRQARQGAPSAPAPAVESEQEKHNRIVASNLGLDRTPTFGGDQAQGGGIFQIVRIGYTDGEFLFFGWNKAISRNSRQLIEVQRGRHRSTEVAVVRRMIEIIREHERADFRWETLRTGRLITLSARPQDDAELEAFLLKEFFGTVR